MATPAFRPCFARRRRVPTPVSRPLGPAGQPWEARRTSRTRPGLPRRPPEEAGDAAARQEIGARQRIRRRRSVSRVLSSRSRGGSSSHSSGPPVAQGIERPTRGNGRAARVRPRGRASLLLGLAPGGVYRVPALTSGPGELLPHRFTIAPRLAARGCLLSVALSPDRSGPPLAATLPCGVRTFLPPPGAASDCSTSSGGSRPA